MKRMHIHVGVKKLDESILFYNALFGALPVKVKPDYAKWMLDDPFINFAISTRSGKIGIDHLGMQVDDAAELSALRDQLSKANLTTHSEGETVCCYAKSEKTWVEDPTGIAWEAYHTMEDAQMFSGKAVPSEAEQPVPEVKAQAECCAPQTAGCCN